MSKHKAGLQKQISAIFDGVPIPKNDDTQQPSSAPASERSDYFPGKPLAPSHLTTTTRQPDEPAALQPEAAPTEQSKTATVVNGAGQSRWQQSLRQIKDKLFASKPSVNTTRQKTMTVLVPALFIVFIFVVVQVLSPASRKPGRPQKLSQTKAVAASGGKIDWQIPVLWPATLRDPMQFGSTTGQAEASRLIVRGIVDSKSNPTALVGSQIVRQGEKVLGATVVKINKNAVEFEMNGKRWKQKVQP